MYYPFHSQKEWIMKSCKVVLTFESVAEILWCYHSNETSSAVLSHGTINLVCSSNFWVCGWNPTVSQFKWHLFGRTFEWYYLFFSKRKFGAFVQFWTWSLLDTPCKPPPKKAGLHATICRPDLSARQCRSANRTCILTPDLRPIRENENRPDSENLLQCNRFLCSRADTFKEADMSIKILSREHAYKSEAIKMADKKTPKRPKSRSFQEEEISLLISEWFKYPCLFDKGSKDYHDKNKREIARTHIARSLNEQASTSCFSFSSLFVS